MQDGRDNRREGVRHCATGNERGRSSIVELLRLPWLQSQAKRGRKVRGRVDELTGFVGVLWQDSVESVVQVVDFGGRLRERRLGRFEGFLVVAVDKKTADKAANVHFF